MKKVKQETQVVYDELNVMNLITLLSYTETGLKNKFRIIGEHLPIYLIHKNFKTIPGMRASIYFAKIISAAARLANGNCKIRAGRICHSQERNWLPDLIILSIIKFKTPFTSPERGPHCYGEKQLSLSTIPVTARAGSIFDVVLPHRKIVLLFRVPAPEPVVMCKLAEFPPTPISPVTEAP
jgi:hypothetical protein